MLITKDGVSYPAIGSIPANAENSFQYLLVRLLIGAMQVSKGTTKVKQDYDFSTLPQCKQLRTPASAFADFLSSSNIGSNSQRFVKVTCIDNREFYRELLAEFANYFIQTGRENHTTAFIHLYRVLERLSYSVPLLYCATQTDFMGTFKEMKSLFKEELQGELGLFKKFLDAEKFIDKLKLDATFFITFTSTNGYQSNFFNLTKRLYTAFESIDPANHQVELKFKNIPNLLISIRNRIFHARTGDGQSNAKMQEILDSDEYFKCMNSVFCNFLSIVTLQTIAYKYQI